MQPYFRIAEDNKAIFQPADLFKTGHLFDDIEGFRPGDAASAFWLITDLRSREAADVVISFQHLSYADLYIMPDTAGAVITHQQAGAFRVLSLINSGDSRFHFLVKLSPGITYRVLIRSQHTKQYKPVFDFELSSLHHYNKTRHRRDMIGFWMQGAEGLLLLYVLITWATTRYRPYLWLALFIGGFTIYNLALGRFLIDWFFAENPQVGWRLTIHFLHLALAALFLLVLDFWKVKEKDRVLYHLGQVILYGILVMSALSFVINYYTANFRFMARLNGVFLIVQMAYLLRTLKLWKQFDKQERFLAYGVVVYLVIALVATLALFISGEKVFTLYAILSGSIVISVSLLFLTGINGKLWQNEKDKILYLSQLNQLQQQQNLLLEESVAERTRELNGRNERIELLMNELNHRVKNNLQMLYSLNGLQLSGNKDPHVRNILTENIVRIKAMMLMNDRLNPENITGLSAANFISDITEHSKSFFSLSQPVDIRLSIDDTLFVDATTGLCLGLIITELLTNSYKHAFLKQPNPQITIDMKSAWNHWMMSYHDNGPGFQSVAGDSFGMTLIADLTRQLRGSYTLDRNGGANYLFKFSFQ